MSRTPSEALKHHTLCLTPDTQAKSTPGFWVTQKPYFARPRHGNKARYFVTGESMMEEVAAAIRSATEFLFFVDWQMDYDVELTQRGQSGHPARFTELLVAQLDKHPKLEVRVLLYDSVESPAYTHENEVRKFLSSLNKPGEKARVQVAVQQPNTGRGYENMGFSHHQKMIVVDGKVGFIGGIDVTYGRWDNGNFDVVADPLKHRINDMYNPGLGKGRKLTAEEIRMTQPFLGEPMPKGYKGRARPGFAPTYYMLTILMSRANDLWDRGASLAEVQRFIDMIDPSTSAQMELKKAFDEFAEKVKKAEAVYDEYMAERAKARRLAAKGDEAGSDATLDAANKKLRDMALKAAGDKIDNMKKSVMDVFVGLSESAKASMRTAEYYGSDPSQLFNDAKTLWVEIGELSTYLTDLHGLEEGCQPRMPWQDVHARLDGPAVFDMYKNFVRRWNTCCGIGDNEGTTPLTDAWLDGHGGRAVFGNLNALAGDGVSVQIVRSMSQAQIGVEWSKANVHNTTDFATGSAQAKTQTEEHKASVSRHGDGVLQAMYNAIRSAEAYIYIETQFFISDCGESDTDAKEKEKSPASNGIVAALATRIGEKIAVGQDFHVYVVLPVHPEGNIMAPAVAKQHYWILQSIKRGSRSLLYRVCEFMVMKEKGLLCVPEAKDVRAKIESNDWSKYLTFLNLRNYGFTALYERDPKTGERDTTKELGRFVVTEQCYVHSKLTIVDDAVVIIGSANINDRSLNGNGDSEIAAVIIDNDKQDGVDLGNGVLVTTRTFAKEMRQSLWKKHFGMKIESDLYTVGDRPDHNLSQVSVSGSEPPLNTLRRAAGTLPKGIALDKPASVATVKAIRETASKNAKIYESVFLHTPRNSMKTFEETTHAWPKRWSKTAAGKQAAKTVGLVTAVALREPGAAAAVMKVPGGKLIGVDFAAEPPVLQAAFMKPARAGIEKHYGQKEHNLKAAFDALSKLQGFFTLMPLWFGSEEKADIWLGGKSGAFLIAGVNGQSRPERTFDVLRHEPDGVLS